jgi:ABC-2 type transport system permease protein
MTAATIAPAVAVAPAAAANAITRLAIRQVRRGAFIVAAVSAGMSAVVAVQYRTTFEGTLDQSGLQALAENPAIRILFGPPVALDDPGGFTFWRTGTPLLILSSVWILLAATRITRGEEDAGRIDLLLAGRLRMVTVALRAMAALAGAALLISAAVAAALIGAGTDATGALCYAAVILAFTLTFATAAVLAAQVMPTRSAAVGVTVGLLAVAQLMRMLADGTPRLAWTTWVNPFALAARAAPYADNRVGPLLVLGAGAIVFGVAALLTARQRDVGRGMVRLATRRAPRTALLGSIGGFAVRRAIRPTTGWAAGIAAYFLLVGALIASVLEFFESNRRFAELAAGAGFAGLDSADGFAAALFSLLAIPTGIYGATRLAALAGDEQERRWTAVFATNVSRIRLLCSEIAVTTTGVLLLHVAAGLAMWTGATMTGAPLSIADALAGALNSSSIAWLAIGAAALAIGWLPSVVGVIGALPVVGGFLLDVIAASTDAPAWLARLSPFAHLAPVPNAPPAWPAIAAIILIGVGLTVAGIAGYARRDLTT